MISLSPDAKASTYCYLLLTDQANELKGSTDISRGVVSREDTEEGGVVDSEGGSNAGRSGVEALHWEAVGGDSQVRTKNYSRLMRREKGVTFTHRFSQPSPGNGSG